MQADSTGLFLLLNRSKRGFLGAERSTGRLPNGGSKPRPAVPPPDSDDARSATKTAPKRLIFSRNDLQGMGNKSPLFASPNFPEKGLDLKLQVAPKFGQALALFIGQSEPSSTLGRLAHCLRSFTRPWIDLDRASSDRICNLQVSRTRPNFRPL